MNASTTARMASDSGGGATAWPAVSRQQARLSRMAHDQVRMEDVCSNTLRFYDRAPVPATTGRAITREEDLGAAEDRRRRRAFMKLTEQFLAELDREAPRTRRTLEQVPLDRDDWKPHDKSMPLARLAGLVASMPSWVALIIDQDELNPTPPPGQSQHCSRRPTSSPKCTMGTSPRRGKRWHGRPTTTCWSTSWRLAPAARSMEQPRHVVLRETLMHLRIIAGSSRSTCGCAIGSSSVYGPTADDQTFG